MKKMKNRGSTLIMVVVGVAVMSILGLMILLAATTYYRTIIVDGKSKHNFYGTEAILEEVRNGLGEYSATANEATYKYLVENYTGYVPLSTGDTREDTYAKLYLSKMIGTLTNNASYSWTGNSPKADGVTVGFVDINVLKKMTNSPSAVIDTGNVSLLVSDLTKYSLTIKNVTITYTTTSGYSTTLTTDIVLGVPNMHLTGNTTFDELKDYIVVSDDSMELNSTVGTGTTVTGNVYTGDGGINVLFKAIASFNSDMMISRGNIDVKSGSTVSINGFDGTGLANIWAENFILSKALLSGSTSDSTNVSCNANSYIANDLAINDDNAKVNLSGAYYGYNYNQTNSTATTIQDSQYSSAILVNGLNNYLDMDGIQQLVLAGRAFVSRKDASNNSVHSDIQMGESLSVKSNQVAYLIPNDYIVVGHNPVLKDEWQNESSMIDSEALLASDIGQYLNTSKPYIENFFAAGYVYYFLNFKSDYDANAYFKKYYQSNKDSLLESARTYITSTNGTNIKLSPSLYLLAGHIVDNYTDSGSSIDEANYFNGTSPDSSLLSDAILKAKEYMGRQLTLLPQYSGTDLHFTGAEGKKADALIDQMIDFSAVNTSDSHDDVYIFDGDYEITTPMSGLILCTGNVTCSADFEGLIIAKGKVIVSQSNIKMTSNPALIKKLLAMAVADEKLKKYFKISYAPEAGSDNQVDVMDYITYENWEKNKD